MDYGPSDSSGTDDDLPPTHQNRIRAAPRITGNGRAGMLGNLTYNRVQNDVESEVHWLEQEAYSSVLKAFKAQADVITWEQAELMSALRKELRVSDDEHRQLLGRVNTDDVVNRIREWRKSGSIQHNVHATAQPGHEPAPSPSVSASRKKQKTSHSAASLSLGAPSPALQPRIVAAAPMHPSSSVAKHGAVVGTRGKKPKSGHAGVGVDSMLSSQHVSGGPAGQGGQIARWGASLAGVQVEPKESASFDPLIGRKVRTRWPEDNNFYEAVITDYNPKEIEVAPNDLSNDPSVHVDQGSLVEESPKVEEENCVDPCDDSPDSSPVSQDQPKPVSDSEQNRIDVEYREHSNYPRRQYPNPRGSGRRGYMTKRGGHGNRGRGYQNGRNQYYETGNNYYPRNHDGNHRGRGRGMMYNNNGSYSAVGGRSAQMHGNVVAAEQP